MSIFDAPDIDSLRRMIVARDKEIADLRARLREPGRGSPPSWYTLTETEIERCCARIRSGVPIATAMVAELGLSERRAQYLLSEGREAWEVADEAAEADRDHGLNIREVRKVELVKRLVRAWHQATQIHVDKIAKADTVTVTTEDGKTLRKKPQWGANAFLLARTRPEFRARGEEPPAPPTRSAEEPSETEREAELRAYARAKGLRLVAEDASPVGGYDPETATRR